MQNLLSSILSVFWDMGIADLIDSFKDVQKVLHGFYSLFEKWYLHPRGLQEPSKTIRSWNLSETSCLCRQLPVRRISKIYLSGIIGTNIPVFFFPFNYFCPFPSFRTALKNSRKALPHRSQSMSLQFSSRRVCSTNHLLSTTRVTYIIISLRFYPQNQTSLS